MIFFIPIEVKIREFFSKTFLAYHIVKKGNEVIIGGQRNIPVNISKMQNCYWLDKNLFFKKVNKKNDMRYINNNFLGMLDEEGPISFFEKISSEMRYPKELINYYNTFLFWGREDLKVVNKKISNIKSKIVIGHPKYDLLKKPFIKIWDKEVNRIKNKYGKFILFNSSFRLRPSKIENRKHIITARENLKNKQKLKEALNRREKLYQIEEKNYLLTIELIKELAFENPNRNFIYRPHPNEDFDKTKLIFGSIPKNLHLVYKGEVTPWIISSDIFLHSGCTTVLEAATVRKKIICFIPFGKSHRYNMYSKIGFFFTNKKLCKNYINKIFEKKDNKLKLKYVSKIIENFDNNKFFYKKFLLHIKKIHQLKDKSKINMGKKLYSKTSIFLYRTKQKIFKILSLIKDIIILNTPLIYLLSQKYIYSKYNREKKLVSITKKEIKDIFNKIRNSENSKLKFEIKRISQNVFKIRKAI